MKVAAQAHYHLQVAQVNLRAVAQAQAQVHHLHLNQVAVVRVHQKAQVHLLAYLARCLLLYHCTI